jgi:hypothetical protein
MIALRKEDGMRRIIGTLALFVCCTLGCVFRKENGKWIGDFQSDSHSSVKDEINRQDLNRRYHEQLRDADLIQGNGNYYRD